MDSSCAPGGRPLSGPSWSARRRLRCLLTVAVPATAQAAEVYPRPHSGALHFVGRGFGHGIGMSQFGAEGMGRSGKNYHQILAFYYPGTTMSKVADSANIRVQLSAAPRRVHRHASVTFDALPGSFAGVVGQPSASLPRARGRRTGQRLPRRAHHAADFSCWR